MPFIQARGNFCSVHPGRAKFLKGRFRSAAHRNPGILQYFQSRIENRSLQRAQIWRGRNPAQSGVFEKIIATPVFHGDDVQIATDFIFGVK